MSEDKSTPSHRSAIEFLKIVAKSGIVDAKKLTAIDKQVRKSANTISTEKLIDRMIHAGLLTEWQTDKLRKGRYKGFFLGKYKMLSHLGTGGMSTVYLAQQMLTGQRRAIKVLPKNKITERSYLPRFYQEARTIAALNHPNIIKIYDVHEQDDIHYMVMEYVNGRDLYELVMQDGPLDFELARDCIVQAATGLTHAHDRNLIHRDVKPANLFRTDNGTVKVLDLGLALLKSDDDEHGLSKQYNEKTMGTADYLSPEQAINSHTVDHRSDIYSLGCTLYYLLAGQPPFNEGTLAQRIAKHQLIMPVEVRQLRQDCPADLNQICMKMLQKEPNDRFENCEQIVQAFETNTVSIELPEIKIQTRPPSEFTTVETPTKTRKKTNIRSNSRGRTFLIIAMAFLLVSSGLSIAIWKFNFANSPENRNQTKQHSPPNNGNILGADRSSKNRTAFSTGTIDFEKDDKLVRSNSKWDLSNYGIEGFLGRGSRVKIVKTPSMEVAKFGNGVLQIKGNSEQFVFQPRDRKQVRLSRVQFWAKKQTIETNPVKLQCKSFKQFENWQDIADLTYMIHHEVFSKIEITEEDFNKVETPQKFRLTIDGDSENGILLDHLSIELK